MLASRRRFLQATSAMMLAAGCGKKEVARPAGDLKRVMVLGVDGMDHALLQQFISEGSLPNCKRLMEMGSFSSLATSNPPQSPVAWSNFISGTNPGGHGIFDFIARDPESWNSMAYPVPSFEFLPTFRQRRAKPEPWPEWERPICRAAMARLRGSPTTSKRELAMFQEAESNVSRFGIMSSNVSYEDQSMSSLQIRNKARFP
jgi:hypothetical protein